MTADSALLGEEFVEEALASSEQALREAHRLGILVRDFFNSVGLAVVDPRAWVGEDNRRVGGDDELRVGDHEFMDATQTGQAVLRRERRFWFVEQVQAARAKAVEHDREERFAMGPLVQGDATVGAKAVAVQIFDVSP